MEVSQHIGWTVDNVRGPRFMLVREPDEPIYCVISGDATTHKHHYRDAAIGPDTAVISLTSAAAAALGVEVDVVITYSPDVPFANQLQAIADNVLGR